MDSRIYLDNNSTTALEPEVLKAMEFDLCTIPRNPSSVHSFGQEARNELIKARRTIAKVFAVDTDELFFSSGGSESNNFLTKGFLDLVFPKEVITTKIEHSSILKNIEQYEKRGGKVTYLNVGEEGAPNIEDIKKVLHPGVGLIILMAVNNETGVKTDIEAVAKLAHELGIPFLVDGVALLGKEPLIIYEGISGMSFSGHKLHAPKGIGLTYLRQSHEISPLIVGGHQESGQRAGTHNLAGILGLSKAVELLEDMLPEKTYQMERLRDQFEKGLLSELKNIEINGKGKRICNTSNIAFKGIDGEGLMMNLDLAGVAVSHGSACSSGSLAPSRILKSMGLSDDHLYSSLRFSLSRNTTEDEINRAIKIVIDTVKKM